MGYDIIGDIHGHADALVTLLRKLGYREQQRAWKHPGRTAIFVGDFIDRGPGQLETVRLVRSMVDASAALAVMGNHEFNAIAWNTPHPDLAGEYLRLRNAKNHEQHAAFLAETASDPERHQNILDWFLTLPLWLDLPGLRVIHACWHPDHIAEIAPLLKPGHTLDAALVAVASDRGSRLFRIVEDILKGPEVALPEGRMFPQGGHMRSDARVRWWDASATTFRQASIVDADTQMLLPDTLIPDTIRLGYDGDKPVFFGHYWMTGAPRPLAARVACVDYSAGRGGPLVAYRWDGEEDLVQDHFVST
jgi:hypothetical protein